MITGGSADVAQRLRRRPGFTGQASAANAAL